MVFTGQYMLLSNGMITDTRNRRRLGTLVADHILMAEGCASSSGFYGITVTDRGSSTPQLPSAMALPSNGYGGVGLSYSTNYFEGVHLRHMYGTTANYLFPDFHVESSDKYHKYTFANLNTDPGKISNIWYQP